MLLSIWISVSVVMIVCTSAGFFLTQHIPVIVLHVMPPLCFFAIFSYIAEFFNKKKVQTPVAKIFRVAIIIWFGYMIFRMGQSLDYWYTHGELMIDPNSVDYTSSMKWILVGLLGGGALAYILITLEDYFEKRKWRLEREAEEKKYQSEIKARLEAGEEHLRAYYESLCESSRRKAGYRIS